MKYDALFRYVAGPGITAKELVAMLAPHAAGARIVLSRFPYVAARRSFNRMTSARRREAAEDYLRRNPPLTMEERDREQQKRNPLLNVLLHDVASPPGCVGNIYDSRACEWYTTRAGNTAVWTPKNPLHLRKFIEPCLPSQKAVLHALVTLAVQLRMAFRVSVDEVARKAMTYPHVLMPKGDLRCQTLAHAQGAYEIDGMPDDTALLFEAANQEDNGMLTEHRSTFSYGLAIWGRFYAIQLDSAHVFPAKPSIPIGSP